MKGCTEKHAHAHAHAPDGTCVDENGFIIEPGHPQEGVAWASSEGAINYAAIEATLRKLRIKPGLRGDLGRKIDDRWAISFEYDRQGDDFTLTLRGGPKTQTVTVQRTLVETRTRSQWMTDATWRLTEEGIALYAQQIAKVLTDPRAKRSVSSRPLI